MKKFLTVTIFFICLSVSFFGGFMLSNYSWRDQIAAARTGAVFVDVQSCIVTVDSNMLRFIAQPDTYKLRDLMDGIDRCRDFLDTVGQMEFDTRTDETLGEIGLFYRGYLEVIGEIIETQIQLEALYSGFTFEDVGNIQTLVEQQTRALEESKKFLDRLENLIANNGAFSE